MCYSKTFTYRSLFSSSTGELLRHPGGAAGHPHEAGDAEGAAGLRQVERRGNRRKEPAGRHTNEIKMINDNHKCSTRL